MRSTLRIACLKTIRDTSWVPSGGGWKYIHRETQHPIVASSLPNLFDAVRKYNEVNHFPNGLNIEQEIIDQICARVPENCNDTEPPTLLELASRFTREMLSWSREGFSVVDDATFATRQSTCNACPKWRGEAAFGVGRCGSCGCLGLKLYVKTSRCPDGKW